ncbi:MAG TPA: hypothetical protein VFE19_00110 [Jatrophihabitantaceae bacterium]|jgi:hypothetical protein|nr:hypothetical protein [Jatrophihabitantaceae bacterium]
MRAPSTKQVLGLIVGVALAAALFAIGRWTAPTSPAHKTDQSNSYFDGIRVGEVEGRRQGRALQEGASVPASLRRAVRASFNDGYTAGGNDAFQGYDGGWTMGLPYVIVLEPGSGQIVYRIKSRNPLEPGVDYYLCGRSLCHQPR